MLKNHINTAFITAIRKGEINPNDINKLNKAVFEGLKTVKEINTNIKN